MKTLEEFHIQVILIDVRRLTTSRLFISVFASNRMSSPSNGDADSSDAGPVGQESE